MASLAVMIKIIVVSTLLSLFGCDTETQNIKEILGRIDGAMKTKQQFIEDQELTEHAIHHALPRTNSFEEKTKPLTEDSDIDELWREIGKLMDQVGALEDDIEDQQGEIDQVKKDVDGMETNMQRLSTKTDNLDDITNEHEGDIANLKAESIQYNAKLTKIEQGSLGFTAYATGVSSAYFDEDILQFEAVHYNSGNHFDTNSGKFKCPYHGFYLFGANIAPLMSSTMSGVVFSVNGVKIDPFIVQSNARINDVPQIIYETTTANIVIECKAGQNVWLEAKLTIILQATDRAYSTFSGVLVHRLDL